MSICYAARWVLPIEAPPIARGWVEVDEGRVRRVGAGAPPVQAEALGDVAILPGLVNAHTHLELSGLAGRVPPAASMVDWIRELIAVRGRAATGGEAVDLHAARDAARVMRETGTVLVGDITNNLTSIAALAEAALDGVIFHELLGFDAADPDVIVRNAWSRLEAALEAGRGAADLRPSVIAHAPYSVSPGLFAEIAWAVRDAPLAVHLGESVEELEFLRTGRGAFRDLLTTLGVWTDEWTVPGCDPVEYVDRLGYLRPGVLAVHGVHLHDAGLERLRDAGGVLVTCPRSNEWVGAGMPPLARFYASGVPVAIGTDSLASVGSLNLFDELAELRRIGPDVSAASLLESATRVGAEALGFGADYGTIAPGRKAALLAVDVPPRTADVEEYLVSGVPPAAIHRLGA
jgi:cytosine/adenosine deaminase-related metal-dependent hydrolase